MGISFSSQGSTAGTPTKGLLGNSKTQGLPGILATQQKRLSTPATPITPFVPGTQSKIQGTENLNSPDRGNGTPTAAGSSSLQGQDYFKGLLNSTNPTERQAGQTWLSHQTTPGLLPSTPVKKITTGADGTTTHEFHGPEASDKKNTTASPTSEAPKPTTPQVGTPTQNAQNVLDTSNLNNNPQYQRLASQNNLLTQAQNNVSTAGTAGSQNTVDQAGTDLLGTDYSNIFRPQSTGNLAGEKGILNPRLVNAVAGNTAEANRLLSGAQLATGGAENVLGASTYSPTSYGQTNTSGLTGVQDAGQYGTGPAAAANVQSIKDLQGAYNQGLVNLKAADGIQNQIASTLQSNPQLNTLPISAITNLNELLSGQISSGPQQLLSQQIHQYIQTLGLDPATVTNIAHQQQGTLAHLLESLRQTAQTQNDAKNPSNLNIKGASSGSGGSSGAANPWK